MPLLTEWRLNKAGQSVSSKEKMMQAYRFDPYDDRAAPEQYESLESFRARMPREEDHHKPDDYLKIPHVWGSDYSGSSIEVANCKAFLEAFGNYPGVVSIYGGYGTYGVLVRRSDYLASEEMQEVIQALEDYPVIDDELVSEIELEAEEYAWTDWAANDFRKALIVRFPTDEEWLEAQSFDTLRPIFYLASESINEYWQNEMGNSAWIDVERVANAVTTEMLTEAEKAN